MYTKRHFQNLAQRRERSLPMRPTVMPSISADAYDRLAELVGKPKGANSR
jgi:hypothetical protein